MTPLFFVMHDKSMTKSGRRTPGKKICRMKFGSAVIPVYEGVVRGTAGFTVAYYSEGRRIGQTFATMDTPIGEARTAATKIQNGMARVTDLSVADRDAIRAAQSLLSDLRVPLLSAMEEYVRCRKLLVDAPMLPAVEEYLRRTERRTSRRDCP